jgi:hypothetical protein
MASSSETWNAADLDRIGRSEELQVSSHRADSSLRPFITIWVVEVGDDLYVRSARGVGSRWWRRATASGTGRIRAGDVEREVAFEPATEINDDVDRAYHRKYNRYGPTVVGTVVGPGAHPTTLRLVPR